MLMSLISRLLGRAQPQPQAIEQQPHTRMVRIFLAEQTLADGRIFYRRWSPDRRPGENLPGGPYAKKTAEADNWLHRAGRPLWHYAGGQLVPKIKPFEAARIPA